MSALSKRRYHLGYIVFSTVIGILATGCGSDGIYLQNHSPETTLPLQQDKEKLPRKNTERLRFETKVLNAKRFRFRAVGPALNLVKLELGGHTVVKPVVPGGRSLGAMHQPALPGFTRLLAVPEGARLKFTVKEGQPVIVDEVVVAPVEGVKIGINKEPALEFDTQYYKKDRLAPKHLAEISYDRIRGGKVALIHVTMARYNPYQRRLLYYPNLEIDVTFEGGKASFIAEDNRSRFFDEQYNELIANYGVYTELNAVDRGLGPVERRTDLVIVTPDEFEAHAEQLADWKNLKGFITRITTLNEIKAARGGASATQIRAAIQDIYGRSNLSYVILLGDAEWIPPHYLTRHPSHGETLMGTDLYYGEMDGEGYLPDIAVGRLSVDTAEQAQRVVNKIITYEQTPPEDPTFYESALFVSYFEDYQGSDPYVWAANGRAETNFVQDSEELRSYLASYERYPHLNRQYSTDHEYWEEGHQGPQFYQDNQPVSEELRWPGFAWDGSQAGIVNVINTGAFLVNYHGHGARSYFVTPRFGTGTSGFEDLENGEMTPVVASFACRTGWFDNETDREYDLDGTTADDDESFAEALTRMEGGAIAVVAFSRNSRGGHLSGDMSRGFYDAIWTGFLPSAIGVTDQDAARFVRTGRLGDALNYAKYYHTTLNGRADPVQDRAINQIMVEGFHLLGDPTMEMWTNPPEYFRFDDEERIPLQPIPELMGQYVITFPIDGFLVTVLQHGNVIFQTMSSGRRAVLDLKHAGKITDEIVVTFSKPGYKTLVRKARLLEK